MAGTLKESNEATQVPLARLVTIVLRYDDALAPAGLASRWSGEKLVFGRGERDLYQSGKLTLKDLRVSTAHAELDLRDDAVVLKDLGSSNGTFLNGQPVEGTVKVNSGDLIEVGRTVLLYREAPAPLIAHVLTGAHLGALKTFNPELGDVYRRLGKIAATEQSALTVGETGTGKEVVAQEVHRASGRPGPLVAIDCGAVPDSLFESTLFGHEKGAFTGATEPRVGEIARAHKGTLFLDEVGNLTSAGQAKLLRVLETRKVTPLGGTKTQEIDVRWLAATNRFLINEGDDFRSDLLHRLAGFVVKLPPLRRRREDLGLLIAALLTEAGARKASITPSAGRKLINHPLPGNVRQLRNLLRRAAQENAEVVVDDEALGELEQSIPEADDEPRSGENQAADDADERHPRGYVPPKNELEQALTSANGNVAEAARRLGTYSRQLYRWLSRAGIDPESFRTDQT